MKRALLFLLLFGGSLAIVIWLDRRPRPEDTGPEPPLSVENQVELPPAEEPAPEPEDQEDDEQAGIIEPGEYFELVVYSGAPVGEDPVRFEVRAEDSALAAPNVWELEDVVAELFDPEDGARQVELRARTGLANMVPSDVPHEPRLEALELRTVVARVERGAPVTPLDVETPLLLLPLETRNLTAPEEAVIQGPSLYSRGRDALLDLPNAQFAFRQGGEIVIRRPEGENVRLASAADLRAYRQAPDAAALPPLFIAGDGGVEIELSGTRSATMVGTKSLLRADEPVAGGGFVVRSLVMEGDVRWTTENIELAAQTVQSALDAAGNLERARFEGLPSAVFTAPDVEAVAGPEALPDDSLIRLSGEGPMDVSADPDRVEVQLAGPATVAAPGADLRCGGQITAWRETRSGRMGFEAGGGVVLEGERSTLETAEIEAVFQSEQGIDPTSGLRVETRGGARLVGSFEEGGSFTLSTPDRLIAERRSEVWRVVEATNVTMTVEGPDGPFEARAKRLTELDLEASTFLAEGNVEFEGPNGRGRGERVRVSEGRNALLEGTPEVRARFDGPQGWVEARTLEVSNLSLEARGEAQAELLPTTLGSEPHETGELYAIRGDALSVRWTEDTARGFSLEGNGNVEGRLVTDLGESVVRSNRLTIERAGGTEEGARDFTVRAEGEVNTAIRDPRGSIQIESKALDIQRRGDAQRMEAEGQVHFSGNAGPEFEGTAHRLVVEGDSNGRLTPLPGERVTVAGRFAGSPVPFRLSADEIRIEDGKLLAEEPEVILQPAEGVQSIRARARNLRGDLQGLELEGAAQIEGRTKKDQPWSLTAQRVWFEGALTGAGPVEGLSGLRAEGDVHFRLERAASAFGDAISGNPLGQMRLSGSPARIESPLFRLEAEWIDFDPELQIMVATGPGTILPNVVDPDTELGGWELNYLAARTLIEPDSLVLALQEPELQYPAQGARLRSTWAALWLDRHRWEQLPSQLRENEQPLREPTPAPAEEVGSNLFWFIQSNAISSYLSEAYFEGPIELTQQDDLVMRAGAFYVDTVSGHGWIADATLNVLGRLIEQDFEKIIVRADWLRYSADNSLRADSATVTPCDHAEPHTRVVTGDLRFTPTPDGYELSVSDNRIELYGLLKIPLPPFKIGTNQEYEPLWQTLRFSDSARFGAFVSAGITRPADKMGAAVNKAFGRLRSVFVGDKEEEEKEEPEEKEKKEYDAKYRVDASWLGSRGALLDLGFETESEGRYWLDMYVGGLPDRGEDKGYIRVDEDDRDDLRLWYRADGRVELSEKSRVDLDVSFQTDAGVQSEFFESKFERYERDESYLRYTRASNGAFLEATVAPRLESFRTQVEELPSFGLYGGRRPVSRIGGVDVLYTGFGDAAYLERTAGDFESDGNPQQSPFSNAPPLSDNGVFADGFGDRDVLRFDTGHRLEVPFDLGGSGIRTTPFLGARFTAWDEGQDRSESPLRWRAEAGLRLATTFWKRTRQGLHQFVPFVEARGELAYDTDGGDPVPFDATDAPIEGNFVDVGFRGRLALFSNEVGLDLEVFNTWADDLADGERDGWQPTSVFARVDVEPFGRAVELWHDGRHDFSENETRYSLVGVATRWNENLRLQAAHHRGRRIDGDRYFEAASIRGVYRWTEKWEFEARQTFSLLEDDDLDTDFLVRRYGHDIIVEVETSKRAGEGSSFSVSIRPRFGFSPSRIGYLRY